MSKQSLEQIYEQIQNLIKGLPLAEQLQISANIVFDKYEDLKKEDALLNSLDVPPLSYVENYNELEEIYSFKKQAFTYISLNAAHDLLTVSQSIVSKKGKEVQ